MSRGDLNAAGRRSGLVGAAAGYRVRRCGRCLVVADPVVPPGGVVLLGVSAGADARVRAGWGREGATEGQRCVEAAAASADRGVGGVGGGATARVGWGGGGWP